MLLVKTMLFMASQQ